MTFEIILTNAQVEALDKLNASSNIGAKIKPSQSEFIQSYISDHLDSLVDASKQSEFDEVQAKLKEVAAQLNTSDLAEIAAIAERRK